MRVHSRFVDLLSVIVVALVILACGEYPGVSRQLTGGSDNGAARLPPASDDTGSTSGSASGSQVVVTGNAVRIELRDFELVPSDLTVTAGEVTFTLVNRGRYTHDFRIEGEDLDEKSPRVSAGRTRDWTVTLAPGAYELSCPISNHADRGMAGTLTVAP